MLDHLQVECLPVEHPEEIVCALCWRSFVPTPRVELLYADDCPVGVICPTCFNHPRQAAEGARKRAAELVDLAKQARDSVSRVAWLTMLQIAQSRASYLEKLAEQIEGLDAWQVK